MNFNNRVMTETVLSIPDLAKRLGVAINTVERWKKQGLQGKKLEVYKEGGRYRTSIEAYERFSAPAVDDSDQPPPPSVMDRQDWERVEEMENRQEIHRTGFKFVEGKVFPIN